jgi:uncharacterized protein YukE
MKTVLVTPEAKAAADRMKAIVHGGLQQQVQDLQRQGNTLAGGAVWKGSKADLFQGSIWPETDTALTKLVHALADLQRRVDGVLDEISAAGNLV